MDRKLNGFIIAAGVSIMIVMSLGVMRLFRFALFAFALLGLVMMIWGIFLARNADDDDELQENKPKRKANNPVEKQLLTELENCAQEIKKREKNIHALEEKAAYYIRKLFSTCAKEKDAHKVFLGFEALKREHGEEVSASLLDTCNTLVQRHRQEIDFSMAEIYYWKTLEKKYDKAFSAMSEAQAQMDELNAKLKEQQQNAKEEDRLKQEMLAYIDEKFAQDDPSLADELYQQEHFSDVQLDVKKQLNKLQQQIEATNLQIEQVDQVKNNYHELTKQSQYHKVSLSEGLVEELRKLSQELEQM